MKILHLETGTRELESGETAHRSLVSQAQQDTAVLREELMVRFCSHNNESVLIYKFLRVPTVMENHGKIWKIKK